MLEDKAKHIKLSLQGMDSRSKKVIMLFLQDQCQGIASVVNSSKDSDFDLYDAEVPSSRALLEARLKEKITKPIIVLATTKFSHEGVLHLKKPIKSKDMPKVLECATIMAAELLSKAEQETSPLKQDVTGDIVDFFNDELFDYISSNSWDDDPIEKSKPEIYRHVTAPVPQESQATVTTPINHDNAPNAPSANIGTTAEEVTIPPPVEHPEPDNQLETGRIETESASGLKGDEAQATFPSSSIEPELEKQTQLAIKTSLFSQDSAQQTTMQSALDLAELNFNDYIDALDSPEQIDPEQFEGAFYNPKDYFQGYLKFALAASRTKKQPILLESDWCPIVLFPFSEEIWIYAKDAEIKAFAELKLNYKTIMTEIALTPIDPNTINLEDSLDKIQNIDAFVWKLACWTSKGRYPTNFDYRLPVYLKHWPDFTRMLITPHALRIAALLIKGPRSMINIAQTLNIKPEYVFVFISAAHAIELAWQTKRSADLLVQPPEITGSKGKEIFGKLIGKLRGK